MRTPHVLWLIAASLALGCSQPPNRPSDQYVAHSSDGRVSFYLADSAVRAAYAAYCESQASCDVIENYGLTAHIEEDFALLSFIHNDLSRQRGLARAFLCSNSGDGWSCRPPPNQPDP